MAGILVTDWLPDLLTLNDSGGDWKSYLGRIYEAFERDFATQDWQFQGRLVRLKKHPVSEGKSATFWHFVSSGSNEQDREIDLRRAERILWPRAFMEHVDDPSMRVWTETRNNRRNIHIWNDRIRYLVVVSDRTNYVLPWTAYPIEYDHDARKLNRRWEQYAA